MDGVRVRHHHGHQEPQAQVGVSNRISRDRTLWWGVMAVVCGIVLILGGLDSTFVWSTRGRNGFVELEPRSNNRAWLRAERLAPLRVADRLQGLPQTGKKSPRVAVASVNPLLADGVWPLARGVLRFGWGGLLPVPPAKPEARLSEHGVDEIVNRQALVASSGLVPGDDLLVLVDANEAVPIRPFAELGAVWPPGQEQDSRAILMASHPTCVTHKGDDLPRDLCSLAAKISTGRGYPRASFIMARAAVLQEIMELAPAAALLPTGDAARSYMDKADTGDSWRSWEARTAQAYWLRVWMVLSGLSVPGVSPQMAKALRDSGIAIHLDRHADVVVVGGGNLNEKVQVADGKLIVLQSDSEPFWVVAGFEEDGPRAAARVLARVENGTPFFPEQLAAVVGGCVTAVLGALWVLRAWFCWPAAARLDEHTQMPPAPWSSQFLTNLVLGAPPANSATAEGYEAAPACLRLCCRGLRRTGAAGKET